MDFDNALDKYLRLAMGCHCEHCAERMKKAREVLRAMCTVATPPAAAAPGVVQVCPECDIADCWHIRERKTAPQPAGDGFCQACRDRADGFYGSWAPRCPVHEEDDSAVSAMLQGKQPAEHRKTTLAERIARAQAEIALWPPGKLATMQLQGGPRHEDD